jgi:hypothetical protein
MSWKAIFVFVLIMLGLASIPSDEASARGAAATPSQGRVLEEEASFGRCLKRRSPTAVAVCLLVELRRRIITECIKTAVLSLIRCIIEKRQVRECLQQLPLPCGV